MKARTARAARIIINAQVAPLLAWLCWRGFPTTVVPIKPPCKEASVQTSNRMNPSYVSTEADVWGVVPATEFQKLEMSFNILSDTASRGLVSNQSCGMDLAKLG